MARPVLSFEAAAELLDLDPGLEAGRIELARLGREEDVDAGLLGDLGIAFFVARVPGEILVRAELRRVDEEARDERIRRAARRAGRRSFGRSSCARGFR
ncbi:MAG: hypothetical protein AUG43_00805 [Actinobacteria bacterium 13_1_20CM_3_68_10]|nr:MAG: hypothetical protein AUG43_00805 [Actinobacteria bacterium 13_1_20CM_3_68_10]